MKPIQHPLKPLLAALLLAGFSLAAHAAGQLVPGAGAMLQQVPPVTPPAPSSKASGMTLSPKAGATLPASAPFLV